MVYLNSNLLSKNGPHQTNGKEKEVTKQIKNMDTEIRITKKGY